MKHARSDYDRFQDPAGLIPDDEPVLLIRGQDKAAPATAEFWAAENDRLDGDPAMSEAVRAHADLIRQWHSDRAVKVADVPPGIVLSQRP